MSQESSIQISLVLVSSVSTEPAVRGNLGASDLDAHSLQHISSFLINVDLILLKSRHGRDVVKAALSLLLLELQGDSTHGSTLNSLHQVLSINQFTQRPTVTYPAILLRIFLEGRSAHSLTDYALPTLPTAYSLVVLEVQSKLLIVLLHDSGSSSLDGFSTHATLHNH